ncbi:MAG TPA: hypothetical protein VL574_17120 [Stellaceae bacterium]|jgi:hypothetical protein|nr:hypothetical protein [Stellaceae bacterium]
MTQDDMPHDGVPSAFRRQADWDARIGQFYDYWRSLHLRVESGTGPLPGRQHLDPIEIPHLLPWLKLIDVVREPLRLRYRLIGTAGSAVYGDHTGRWLDEIFPHLPGSAVWDDYLGLVNHARPSYYRGKPRLGNSPDIEAVERLTVPLARDGRQVDMLLSVIIHQTKMPARR